MTAPREDCKDSKESAYYIDYIQEEDKEEVRNFLLKNYYTNEPVAESIGISITDRMKQEAYERIGIGYSLKAVSKESGKIIGVRLCTRVNRGEEDHSTGELNEKEASLMNFGDIVFQGCDVFELYPEIDFFLQGKAICVDPEFRGHGIASALMDRMLALMIEREVPLLRVLCSNAFSARIMRQRGFQELKRVYYADHLDANGNQIFNPEGPHKSASCFVMTLNYLKEERRKQENV